MKIDDGQMERILKETFDQDVSEHTKEPFSGRIPARRSSSVWALNLGRFAAAAGVVGLFWTASVFRSPRPLDDIISKAVENRPTIETIVTTSAEFVNVALLSE